MNWRRRDSWILLGPGLILLAALTLFPGAYNIYMSFQSTPAGGDATFAGLGNYIQAFGDPLFRNSILNTASILAAALAIELVFGLSVAVAIDAGLHGKLAALRPLYLLPMMLPAVVVGTLWRLLFDPSNGLLDAMVQGLGFQAIPWLGQRGTAFWAIVVVDVWEWTPFVILVMVAALSAVPVEPIEAAKVDGAGPVSVFRHIKFHYLLPAFAITIVFRIMDLVKLFDLPYVLTNGGPVETTQTLSLYIYKTAFPFQNPGYAAAMAVVLLVIVSILAEIAFRFFFKTAIKWD